MPRERQDRNQDEPRPDCPDAEFAHGRLHPVFSLNSSRDSTSLFRRIAPKLPTGEQLDSGGLALWR